MRLLLGLLLILPISLIAQTPIYDSTKNRLAVAGYGYQWKNGEFLGPVVLAKDTAKLAVKDSSALATKNNVPYIWNGYQWKPLLAAPYVNADGIDSVLRRNGNLYANRDLSLGAYNFSIVGAGFYLKSLNNNDVLGGGDKILIKTSSDQVRTTSPSALPFVTSVTGDVVDNSDPYNPFIQALGSLSGTPNRITVTGGTATNATADIASTYVGQSSITTLGTIGTGTWNATAIGATKGGTGQTAVVTGDILYGSGTNAWSRLAAGTNGQILTMASGVPAWVTGGSAGWSLTGNSGITAVTNFFGTTDNKSVRFRSNNVERMKIDSTGDIYFYPPGAAAGNWIRFEKYLYGDQPIIRLRSNITNKEAEISVDGGLNAGAQGSVSNVLVGDWVVFNNTGTSTKSNVNFEVRSTSKFSMPFPTMANADAAGISSPFAGSNFYSTNENKPRWWDGSVFRTYLDSARAASMIAANAGWSITGNTGTNSSTNFLGTTDNQNLAFRINNQYIGLLTPSQFQFGRGISGTTGLGSVTVDSSGMIFLVNGTYSNKLEFNGSGVFAPKTNGSPSGAILSSVSTDLIQGGIGQYTKLTIRGAGFGNTYDESIVFDNSYSTQPKRMIIYGGVNSTPPVSILPGGGNLVIGDIFSGQVASAKMNVVSTTQGTIPAPIMTNTQMNAISSPAAGLQVYNSTGNQINYFDGSAWQSLAINIAPIEISGTSQSAAANRIYIPHNASLTTITLPLNAAAPVGSLVQIVGEGAGKWQLAQNASDFIVGVGGATTTVGTGGYILASDANCTISVRKTGTNKWTVTSSQGTLTFN